MNLPQVEGRGVGGEGRGRCSSRCLLSTRLLPQEQILHVRSFVAGHMFPCALALYAGLRYAGNAYLLMDKKIT